MRFVTLACVLSLASGFMPAMENRAVRTASPTVSSPSFVSDAESFCTSTELNALTTVDLGEKYYPPQEKEIPKILGGIKIGLRKLVVITGASSGLGLNCANTLSRTGRYFVVMACRDVEKGKRGTSYVPRCYLIE